MSINTSPYRKSLEPEQIDFADDAKWPTDALKFHVGTLIAEQEFANARKAEELQHQIDQGIGELILRGHGAKPRPEVPNA